MEVRYTKDWVCRIGELCKAFQECSMDVERGEEREVVKEELCGLCLEARKAADISPPGLLMALMDAYEITQDEGMLQEVLNVVSREAGRLEPSADHVRLLSYCYYYVEDEECADLAREMLRTLRGRGNAGEIGRAEQIYHELVEENHSAG